MHNVLFIVNPISGTNIKDKVVAEINKVFKRKNILYKIVFTEYKGHATSIASEYLANSYDTIIAVGGDGTVNEVSKALVGSSCRFGIIPAGSGNGLARALNIPMNYKKAIETIIEDITLKIDTCTINNNHFVNIAGIGFDAQIADTFSQHKKRGFLTYAKLVLKEIFKLKETELNLTFNNKTVTKKLIQASFANSNQFGNNAIISPDAKLNDQLLDVVILRKFPWYASFNLVIKLFNASINKSKYVSYYQTNEVIIHDLKGLKTQIDGEAIELSNTVKIKLLPLSLNVICNLQ